jgi:hypothetical protein
MGCSAFCTSSLYICLNINAIQVKERSSNGSLKYRVFIIMIEWNSLTITDRSWGYSLIYESLIEK